MIFVAIWGVRGVRGELVGEEFKGEFKGTIEGLLTDGGCDKVMSIIY